MWKVKITAINQSGANVVINYQILDNGDNVAADNQQLTINDPRNATISKIKGLLMASAKLLQNANQVAADWVSYVGQTINVD